MSDLTTDLIGEIRGAKAPERSRGHSAPSTKDVAQDPAVTQPVNTSLRGAQVDFPVEGVGGAARRDQANHFGWKLQAGMEIKTYSETIAVRSVDENETVVLDPNIATIWRITAAGNFNLSITDIPETMVGGEPSSSVISLVLYIHRSAGGAITWPSGTLWSADVRDPEGGIMDPPAASRLDVFVLNKVPSLGWVGYVAGLDMGAI